MSHKASETKKVAILNSTSLLRQVEAASSNKQKVIQLNTKLNNLGSNNLKLERQGSMTSYQGAT